MRTLRKLWKHRKKLLVIYDIWPDIVAFLHVIAEAREDDKITVNEWVKIAAAALPLLDIAKDVLVLDKPKDVLDD